MNPEPNESFRVSNFQPGGRHGKEEKTFARGGVVGGGLSKLGLFKDAISKDFFAEAYQEKPLR